MGVGVKLSSPWNPFCDVSLVFITVEFTELESIQHGKQESDGPQQCEGWTTGFGRIHDQLGCYYKYDVANVEFPRPEPVVHKPAHLNIPRIPRTASGKCDFCWRRLSLHLMNSPNDPATIFIDSTELCYVEFSFTDPSDGVLEWRYRLFHSGSPTSCCEQCYCQFFSHQHSCLRSTQ